MWPVEESTWPFRCRLSLGNGHLDGSVRRLRAARLEVRTDGWHVGCRHEELFLVDVERALIDVVVIAFRTAELILVVLDGVSILVESRWAGIIVVIG